MLGQKIKTLVKGNFKAGQHVVNWNGKNDHGLQVPTGVYIYRIKAGEFIAARKMVLIK
jgi:flagellar hook assembly protein FlgD